MRRPTYAGECCISSGGNDGLAIADLDEALTLDPENADAYYIRGTIHVYLKRYERVVNDMAEALRIKPGNAQAWFNRGLAHAELDELALAIDDLTEAIRLDPDNADAYRGRGDCHRYRGEYDLAITDFNAALGLDPEHAWSYRGTGILLQDDEGFRPGHSRLQRGGKAGTRGFLCPTVPGEMPTSQWGNTTWRVADCEAA